MSKRDKIGKMVCPQPAFCHGMSACAGCLEDADAILTVVPDPSQRVVDVAFPILVNERVKGRVGKQAVTMDLCVALLGVRDDQAG
jgi:hypothetical protein